MGIQYQRRCAQWAGWLPVDELTLNAHLKLQVSPAPWPEWGFF